MRVGLAAALVLAVSFAAAAKADIVTNGTFSPANPGDGAGAVAGWTVTGSANQAGSNTSTQPFWDNGTIPSGTTVGFLQGDESFSQTLSLTPGTTYTLSFVDNARDCCDADPTLTVFLNGSVLIGATLVTPVGDSDPFYLVTDTFVATASSEPLDFSSSTGGHDGTLLLSDVSVSTVTPEPSSLILLGTGFLGAMGMMRRRFVRS